MMFTKTVKKFILSKMACGYDVSQICKKWSKEVPSRDSIYRKSMQDKKFGDDVNQAYGLLLMHRLDDLNTLSGMTATEAYPNVKDWRQSEAALKRKIDALKFVLGKMAPILSKRFDKTEKVEVTGMGNREQIVILNYASTPDSKTIDVTPNKLLEE